MTAHEKHMLANRHIGEVNVKMAAIKAKLTYRFIWNYRLSNKETNRLNIFNF